VIVFAASTSFAAWRRRRSRLLQFHLNELVILVTVTALVLSWLFMNLRERDEEQLAIKEMNRASEDGFTCPLEYDVFLTGPQWLRKLVGDRLFRFLDRIGEIRVVGDTGHINIHLVQFWGTFNRPEQLLHLRYLTGVSIFQARTPIHLLRSIARPERIRWLTFVAWDDDELRQVAAFTNLEKLYVDFPDRSTVFVEHSFNALNGLNRLGRLQELGLAGKSLTDAAVVQLRPMPMLRYLRLEGEVTDNSLEFVMRIRDLDGLDVSCTRVTGAGLPQLKNLKRLKYLGLPWRVAETQAAKQLTKDLPDCEIHGGGRR
jgi:hypothetical protein